MLQQAIVTTVDYCTRYAVQIIGIAAALLGLACGIYAADKRRPARRFRAGLFREIEVRADRPRTAALIRCP